MAAPEALEIVSNTVVVGNGRSAAYDEHLRDMAAQGLCPLDFEVFQEIGGERIIREFGEGDQGWVLAHNLEPYPNTEEHLIYFPKRHIISPSEMTAEDRLIVWDILDFAASELDIAYGGIFMRFSTNGMHASAGASVVHLHGQIVKPMIDPETGRAPGWQPGQPTPDEHAVMVKIG